jgi:D-lactate dehydrogenase
MKIAYVTPYPNEEAVVLSALAPHEVIFYAQPLVDTIPSELLEADVLSIFVDSKVTTGMIDAMSNLKQIALRSTGYDHVAVAHAESKGINVSYVPHYGSQTVAEHTFALMLALSRRAYPMYQLLRQEGNLDVVSHEGFDLCGKTIGVIGTGAIGRRVCEIAHGFRMQIRAFDLFPNTELISTLGVQYCTLEDLLANSDIITLHTPATKENHHLLNTETLAKAKPGAFVINTARGVLIDTVALLRAVKAGQLGGAALDVYEGEEFLKDEMRLIDMPAPDVEIWRTFAAEHELLDMPNVIMTPHMAFNTKEAKREITDTTCGNILAAINGQPTNLVK